MDRFWHRTDINWGSHRLVIVIHPNGRYKRHRFYFRKGGLNNLGLGVIYFALVARP